MVRSLVLRLGGLSQTLLCVLDSVSLYQRRIRRIALFEKARDQLGFNSVIMMAESDIGMIKTGRTKKAENSDRNNVNSKRV